jgi:hypothetical protein
LGKALDVALRTLKRQNVNHESEKRDLHHHFYDRSSGSLLPFGDTIEQLFLRPHGLTQQTKDTVPHLFLDTLGAFSQERLEQVQALDPF